MRKPACHRAPPPAQRHRSTPGCKHTSSSLFRKNFKKLFDNHRSNKATLIQLFRQRKGIHNLSIMGLFTLDQSTSIIKQLKCLWVLGMAAWRVLWLPGPSSSSPLFGNRSLRWAGSSSPGETSHPDTAKIVPRSTTFPGSSSVGDVSPTHGQNHPSPHNLADFPAPGWLHPRLAISN